MATHTTIDPEKDAPGHFLGCFPVPGALTGMTPAYAIAHDASGYTLYWKQEDEWLYQELHRGETGDDLARVLCVTTDWREVLPALAEAAPALADAFKTYCEEQGL
ncbi:MAG: hypothetical protein AB7E47_10885 [Desulfovibrionaceae bacterium]